MVNLYIGVSAPCPDGSEVSERAEVDSDSHYDDYLISRDCEATDKVKNSLNAKYRLTNLTDSELNVLTQNNLLPLVEKAIPNYN